MAPCCTLLNCERANRKVSPNGLRIVVLSMSNMLQIFLHKHGTPGYRSLRTIDVERLFIQRRPRFDWRTMFLALDDDAHMVLQDNETATAMLWRFGA